MGYVNVSIQYYWRTTLQTNDLLKQLIKGLGTE